MEFSSAFSSAFAGAGGYIAPMMAQAALHAGAPSHLGDSSFLIVNGRVLIGIAGKAYQFASEETAAVWVERTRAAAVGEYFTRLNLSPEALAAWKAKKRAEMAKRAAQAVGHALRQQDARIRAALIAESSFCLEKWQ